jgi:hypothetical protein
MFKDIKLPYQKNEEEYYRMKDEELKIITIHNTYRITSVLKVETDITARISASLTGRAVILVIMYVKIFKMALLFLSVTSKCVCDC